MVARCDDTAICSLTKVFDVLILAVDDKLLANSSELVPVGWNSHDDGNETVGR